MPDPREEDFLEKIDAIDAAVHSGDLLIANKELRDNFLDHLTRWTATCRDMVALDSTSEVETPEIPDTYEAPVPEERDEEYGLVFDFKIDDGQLDDCTKKQSFVLGFEFSKLYTLITKLRPSRIEENIHAPNLDRLRQLCDDHGYALVSESYPNYPDWTAVTLARRT